MLVTYLWSVIFFLILAFVVAIKCTPAIGANGWFNYLSKEGKMVNINEPMSQKDFTKGVILLIIICCIPIMRFFFCMLFIAMAKCTPQDLEDPKK